MGGRGASSGVSVSGKPYGSEYRSILEVDNIKFVRQRSGNNAKDPLETGTAGRIYVTVNSRNKLNSVNVYGPDGKRVKSINLNDHGEGKGEHVHLGYLHSEHGERGLTVEEKTLVDKIKRIWYTVYGK